MNQNLSSHYSMGALIRFTLPTIFVMIFTSIYGVVDGFFLSNFAGKLPFASVNFIMPFTLILSSIGFMMGSGSAALIGRTLGENKAHDARRQFSGLFIATVFISILTAVIGFVVLEPVLSLMGCTPQMKPYALSYARTLLCFMPFYMMQSYFQPIFVTAGKPGTSFKVTIAGGLINIALDYLLIGVLNMETMGAALATGIGQMSAALLSILCFLPRKESKDQMLRFIQGRATPKEIFHAASNGVSEFFSSAASSIISILYNVQLLRYIGENGVAAYGTLMYVSMIFMAISMGYTMGSAPLVSYQYGAGNKDELASLTRKSVTLITLGSIAMYALAVLLASPISHLFGAGDASMVEVTMNAFALCSPVFLFSGFAMFGSGFFTALNNGKVSAAISIIRTAVFQIGFIVLFPILWGADGIWISMVAAEGMAVVITVILLTRYRNVYGYALSNSSVQANIQVNEETA